MVLIAVGAAAAAKFFGHGRDDAGESVQGDHEMTRFLFGAANEANYDGATDLVSADMKMYANGMTLGLSDDDSGPALLTETLAYYDEHVEDSYWQLYDEVVDDHGKGDTSIAIRFVASGGFAGEHKEVEFAGFLGIHDHQLTEVRFVTDLTVFNKMRTAAGAPPLQ